MQRKNLRSGLFFAIGLIIILILASSFYILLIMPIINGVWKPILIMPWLYGWCYGYYAFTKHYTKWWQEIGE